mmetsp:Transcript_31197/g.31708  ORF Transcript_31197/g.31708 Transcript_31197/m.31708 type:complete len:257 (+) Transcript_31197:34-804(+)
MAEQFFNKIANDVLLAAEQIQSIVMTGELPTDDGGGGSRGGDDGDSGTTTNGDASGILDGIKDNIDFDGLSEDEIRELIAEEMMQNNPLQGIADDVTKNIMAGQIAPQGPLEHIDAFRSAITWSEKFIVGLICFQIVMFLLCLFISRKDRGLTLRVCLLVFIGIVVKLGEWLNEQGAKHWEQFATQNYFDKRGIFIGCMLAGPLLLDSLMMLIFFMSEASTLLIQVKRSEFKQKKNEKNSGKKKSTTRTKNTKKQD